MTAELMAMSNFTFREGASHADELVLAAKALGLSALAITDRNSVAGLVRGHLAAKNHGLRFVPGARLDLVDGFSYLCWPTDRAAWGRLTALLSLGRMRAPKGECHLTREDFLAHAEGQVVAMVAPALSCAAAPSPSHRCAMGPSLSRSSAGEGIFHWPGAFPSPALEREREGPAPQAWEGEGTGTTLDLSTLATRLHADAAALQNIAAPAGLPTLPLHLAVACHHRGNDQARLDALAALNVPLLAVGDVRYHAPERRALADVLTAIRLGCTIDELGFAAEANAERHLKSPAETARLFARFPQAIDAQSRIVKACRFNLDQLRYEYPDEILVPGQTAQARLETLTAEGAAERYPGGVPAEVQERLDHELRLIAELDYAPYFLTVRDIVHFAREQDILCQGRGSAANSAVCYCLGITAVDPSKHDLLFERFVSAARREPPDIDVDFEHERREEVIQHIYQRYGRDRAGLAATVIHWRVRSAIREVGKVFGLSADMLGRIAETTWGPGREDDLADQILAAGFDPDAPRMAMARKLADELTGFPRHLSQHVGGFVITRGKLTELCPVVNAAMQDRTTIEWDKEDIDALGILKVDVLALGMLTCIRKCFDLIAAHHGRRYTLATIPPEDPAVYAMLSCGDSLGVFQVESRAQMAMLPRLKPRTFYDLVIEVAIVRPGPIQGDMVHPYLRRRNGEEPVHFPSEELRQVLGRTLGVPLFQEQAMKIAIVAAGFTPTEADRLRRAMATFRNVGTIHTFREKLITGMVARGYDEAFARRCFQQIEGFGTYGFPESHAASFALLVYLSAWLKCHHPAAFACGLLNSQPMGFYAPAQIVRDAKDHGVVVLGADVNFSAWDSTLQPHHASHAGLALRLGLREIKGFAQADAARLVAAREAGNGRPFASIEKIFRRTGLGRVALEKLAAADACASLGLSRRAALWDAAALDPTPLALFLAAETDLFAEPPARLPPMTAGEEVVADYETTAMSLRAHPLALLRGELSRAGLVSTAHLQEARHCTRVQLAGLVLVRQRPGSAKGVVFITLEDEFGVANLVVLPPVLQRFRAAVIGARLIEVDGTVERQDFGAAPIIHVLARKLLDRSVLLATLSRRGGDPWEAALARADEVKSPNLHDSRVHPAIRRRAAYVPNSRDFR
jgi:error-prone DNA polymerase